MARGFRMGICGSLGGGKKYIYKDGELSTGIGAYAARPANTSYATVNGTVVNADNVLTMTQTSSSPGCTSFITDEIDVTNLNSISFTVSSTSNAINDMKACLCSGITDYSYENMLNIGGPGSQVGIHTVDCSNLSGKYRLAILLIPQNTANRWVKISEIAKNS